MHDTWERKQAVSKCIEQWESLEVIMYGDMSQRRGEKRSHDFTYSHIQIKNSEMEGREEAVPAQIK